MSAERGSSHTRHLEENVKEKRRRELRREFWESREKAREKGESQKTLQREGSKPTHGKPSLESVGIAQGRKVVVKRRREVRRRGQRTLKGKRSRGEKG